MRIAICDDSRLSQVLFISAMREWDPLLNVECFTSGKDLLKAMRGEPKGEPVFFDIIFLDVYFPGESGIEIAGEIKKMSSRTGIVFITNSVDHAVDAYSLNALHYLVKPVTVAGIEESFQRLKRFIAKNRTAITLNVGKDTYIVYLDEIVYILSDKHAKELYLADGRVMRIWIKFQELEEKLNEKFLKLNKGTIVNMEHIRRMSPEDCLLDNGTRFDFSRRERAHIREAYDAYLFSNLPAGD